MLVSIFAGWPALGVLALLTFHHPPLGTGFVWFGLAGLAYVAVVAIHELGHVTAGLLAGLRVSGLRIGPLVLRAKPPGRPRLDWSSDGFRIGRTELDWASELEPRARVFAAVLSGPLASALAFGLCTLATRWVPARSLGGMALTVGRLLSAWDCLWNLVPLRLGSDFATDGSELLRLLRRPTPDAVMVQRISRRSLTLRPSAWRLTPEEIMKAATPSRDVRASLTLLWSALAVAHDSGDFALGAELITSCLALPNVDPLVRFELQLQRVLRTALVDRNRVAARAALKALQEEGVTSINSRLADAAVLLSERHLSAAREAFDAWTRDTDGASAQRRFRIGNEWASDRIEASLKKAA